MIRGNDPILLTPGPLTTSLETKQAMLRDWGSWDASFNAITTSMCKDLVDVVNGAEAFFQCVGSVGVVNDGRPALRRSDSLESSFHIFQILDTPPYFGFRNAKRQASRECSHDVVHVESADKT